MRDKLLITSSYFGHLNTGIWPAPEGSKAFFFSNQARLKERAEAFGWRFIFVDVPLSGDERISSLQSKAIKFMQHELFAEPSLMDATVLYTDHKNLLNWAAIEILASVEGQIILRSTPTRKSISDEIVEALLQDRYRVAMPRTQAWLESMRDINIGRIQVMNTGLILSRSTSLMREIGRKVVAWSWWLGQPECQILFAALSFPQISELGVIKFSEVPLVNQWPDRFGDDGVDVVGPL